MLDIGSMSMFPTVVNKIFVVVSVLVKSSGRAIEMLVSVTTTEDVESYTEAQTVQDARVCSSN